MNLDQTLETFIKHRRVPIFGVAKADDEGYAHSLPAWHPQELMPTCRSVIIFGRPMVVHPLEIEEKTHRANDSFWDANQPVLDQISAWRGELLNLLDSCGVGAANFGGYGQTTAPTFSYRLAQHVAGVGVYGRGGLSLNPEYGCYYNVGVLLVEADLAPTDGARLTGFSPCDGCRACADVCPVRAIDASVEPQVGMDRELCMRFLLRLKERTRPDAKFCARCFRACPWSMGKLGAV